MSTGKLITLEGIEGVGKSTAQSFVIEALVKSGKSVVRTREPGGTPLAESIRQLAVKSNDETVHADTELLLMFAARAQHVHQVIFPALAEGKWVVSDRFVDASFAYQGAGRGLDMTRIALLEKMVLKDFKADLILLLDAPVAIAMQRAKSRQTTDRFEAESHAFFERVRKCYLERAAADPSRYVIINAAAPLDQVKAHIQSTVGAI